MTTQHDLFGQPAQYVNESRPMMKIPGNETLEKACTLLLGLIRETPELIDGDTIAEVDRKIYAEVLWNACFKDIVAQDKKWMFTKAMMKAPDAELYSRARRELQSRDYIRLSSKAVKSGEQFRARISGAMGDKE